MGAALEVEQSETALPLELTVVRQGVGGVVGLTPTVAVRDATTSNRYLDWNDNTFKTGGWVLKYAPMTGVERGHYQRVLNLAALVLPVGFRFTAEYHVDDGATVKGDDLDLFLVTNKRVNVELLRKGFTNRLWEANGNPGTLVLYDDDDVTPLKTWFLADEFGGPVAPATGTPARRSKGLP